MSSKKKKKKELYRLACHLAQSQILIIFLPHCIVFLTIYTNSSFFFSNLRNKEKKIPLTGSLGKVNNLKVFYKWLYWDFLTTNYTIISMPILHG